VSKYKVAIFKNGVYAGDIAFMQTNNLKWFRSKEAGQRFIEKYCKYPKHGTEFKVVDYEYKGETK